MIDVGTDQSVNEKSEGRCDGCSDDGTLSKGSSSLLRAFRWSASTITSNWEGPIDEVAEDLFDPIEGATFGEFNSTEDIGRDRNFPGYSTKGGHLFLGGSIISSSIGPMLVETVSMDEWSLLSRSQRSFRPTMC